MTALEPLSWKVPIVDSKGFPTLEFMVKWAQQQALNAAAAATTIPTPPADATQFLAGTAPMTWAKVKDSDLALVDTTTNNVSGAAHGFAPKLPSIGGSSKFLDGTGAWNVPGNALALLSDVLLTSLSATQILQYNGTKWVNVAIPASTLAALTDVNLTALSNNQYLQYDSGTGKWKNVTLSVSATLAGLTDVQLTSLVNTNHLQYDSSVGKWKNVARPAISNLSDCFISSIANGQFLVYDSGSGQWKNTTYVALQTFGISFIIDGGGQVITTGNAGYIEIPFACTLTKVDLLADQTGSIVVEIRKCTYAQFDAGATHPVTGDKITFASPPTLSSANKATDSALTGWTTSFAAGDILAFNVNSITTCQRVTVALTLSRS